MTIEQDIKDIKELLKGLIKMHESKGDNIDYDKIMKQGESDTSGKGTE